jgi:hypothetical protein
MKPLVFIFSLTIGFLLGCEDAPSSPEELEKAALEVVAKYRERIEQRQAVYLEIARAAAAVPAKDFPLIDLESRPKLPDSCVHPDRQDIDLNFLLDHKIDPFHAPDFLCLGGTSWYGSPVRWLEGDWGEIFRDRTAERVTEFMTEWCDQFLEPRYLFIIRANEFKVPQMLEDYAEPKDGFFSRKIVGSYEEGSIVGDVLVFEVEGKKFLGGVAFSGENAGQISTEKFKRDPDYLRTDLARQARHSFYKALEPYVSAR